MHEPSKYLEKNTYMFYSCVLNGFLSHVFQSHTTTPATFFQRKK